MNRSKTGVWLLAGAMALPLAAQAETQTPAPDTAAAVPKTVNGIPYVTGGVGMEERQAMQSASPDYNLKLTFADRGSGEYRSAVAVDIRDMRSGVQVQADQAGPLFYTQLPAGRYKVTATAAGRQQQKVITVARHGDRSLAFYWDAQ
ncbi:carboxypeptidase regulatory-like domain-containing protein [Pseudoduganella namucuonensis]|uniref:Carboxypeptidase regulatory-like domain-containing protein n=1 Tax=Pseudoduganella namucuonensis TaxID=1035707 RepID=A0A1I7KNQ3_9BURK|nr:carboxypeptidase regulatory-like domain-containing protein [Pseudoduganella namucuonensis]SFU98994.1 hypothetical protein SAMN05216552_101858 [Pseudoduganella namucuonensis]